MRQERYAHWLSDGNEHSALPDRDERWTYEASKLHDARTAAEDGLRQLLEASGDLQERVRRQAVEIAALRSEITQLRERLMADTIPAQTK